MIDNWINGWNVLITGVSNGIGLATAELFLRDGFDVYGLDLKPAGDLMIPKDVINRKYHHYQVDIRDKEALPDLHSMQIVINNAGQQNSDDDLGHNLIGSMNVTEKYALNNPHIRSVLFNASASAHTGFEFAEYSASKAGLIGYMKHCAWRLAKVHATCNSISCGGVATNLNDAVMEDEALWDQIMKVTPLKQWATAKEIAEWIYFLTVTNKSCSGQDILIDNGEKDLNCTFVWPNFS